MFIHPTTHSFIHLFIHQLSMSSVSAVWMIHFAWYCWSMFGSVFLLKNSSIFCLFFFSSASHIVVGRLFTFLHAYSNNKIRCTPPIVPSKMDGKKKEKRHTYTPPPNTTKNKTWQQLWQWKKSSILLYMFCWISLFYLMERMTDRLISQMIDRLIDRSVD